MNKEKKNQILKYVLIASIVLVGLLFDQLTKHIFDSKEIFHEGVSVIKNFFYIRIAYNTGVSWSMFQGNFVVLYIIPIIALVIFAFLIHRGKFENMKLYLISLSLMTSGTIGNYLDRIILRHVIDFLEFNFGSYTYPTFNIADSMLVIGVILFSIDILFLDSKRLKKIEAEVVDQND